jgi:membrane protein implicated in regulation of membrane protease activity
MYDIAKDSISTIGHTIIGAGTISTIVDVNPQAQTVTAIIQLVSLVMVIIDYFKKRKKENINNLNQ